MLILRYGVTGFYPAPSVSKTEFRDLCYSLFRKKIFKFIGGETGKSFYECIIKEKDDNFHILLNAQYPFLAFTAPRKLDTHDLPFIEIPEIAKPLNQFYEILSPAQLNEPFIYTKKGRKIRVKNKNKLHHEELQQIAYWESKTVGEVVFNFYD
ncbi:hypothetical protein BKP45_14240 [Anaerobacillus alkalidiazotrophicus]|uniref:Uncharacterized protein n=1 Tax=Anaerobacillus alkalidiazotrophicus TaxID=472963 RepID=A0A1S2M3Y3_9BACI|nr:hypothetical protein [Anaerobacillus alkalidiazotrophicus]OIJ19163.1 hypothetical protein BKP45_14240 [Anaerobacillus alkalidiazotrophicus]